MNASKKCFQPELLTRIASLELRARQVVEGFVSGLHQSPYKGFSVEFADYREYVPGDDIRHIDWRLFARADRYYIKEYEVETNLRTHVLLDGSGSMAYPEHAGTARMRKWDYAATLAACIAYLQVYQQDGAGLVLFDDDIRAQLPVSDNRALLRALIEVIERHEPSGPTDVKMLFHHLADRVPRRGMVVIISDLLTDLDDVLAGLQRLRHGNHDVIVLHVLDYDEIEFPFVEQTMFEGIEDARIEIRTDPQSLRNSYLQEVQGFISAVRSACLNQRIDYALLNTRTPLDVALTSFLANRMHRLRVRV